MITIQQYQPYLNVRQMHYYYSLVFLFVVQQIKLFIDDVNYMRKEAFEKL